MGHTKTASIKRRFPDPFITEQKVQQFYGTTGVIFLGETIRDTFLLFSSLFSFFINC